MGVGADLDRSWSIGRILNLRAGEAGKVLHFALLGLLLQLGLGIGFSAGDALFIVNVGSASLPIIFVLTPVVMLLYTPVFSWLAKRFGMQRACQILVWTVAAAGGVIFVLLELFAVKADVLYYFIKIYLAVLYISVYSVYWMAVDDYFSIDDGKRLYPLFSVGCSVGTATGALLVSVCADRLPVGAFFLIWAAVAGLTIPVLAAIPRVWDRIPDHNARVLGDDSGTGFVAQQKVVLRSLLASRFALLMSAMLFLTLIITNIIEYQYSAILEKDRSEVELVTIMGRLYGATHFFNIAVGLFVFSPMVRRFGVKNVALILPSVYMATFILLFTSSSIVGAAVAFWAYHGVLTSVEYNNQNLLFNALPAQTRRELRTMIEGLCEPLASCVSGLFLLALQESWGLRQIAGIALLVAALLLGAAFGVRNVYPAAMSHNMRLGWLNLGAARRLRISPGDQRAVSLLVDAASGPPTSSSAEALAMLIEIAPSRAMPIVLTAVTCWPCERHGQLEPLLQRLMRRSDESLFMQSLTELLRLDAAGNQIARRQLARLALPVASEGAGAEHGARSLLRDLGASHPGERARALGHLGAMLAGDAPQRRAGAELLGLQRDPSFECDLIKLLDDRDDQVRAAALGSLRQLARHDDATVADAMLKRLVSFNRTERSVALAILEVAANAEQLGAMLEATALLSATEMREVEDILTSRGQLAVPVLVVAVGDRHASYPSRRVAARALSRLSLKHLDAIREEVVGAEIEHMEELGQRIEQIGSGPERSLLIEYYNEQMQTGLEFALEVLALVGALPDFDLIAASLQSSSAKVRADALETISSSLDSTTFRRIAGVIEPGQASGREPANAGGQKDMVAAVLEQAVAHGDAIESALAAEALSCLSSERFEPAVRSRLLQGDAALVSEVVSEVVDARSGLKRPSRLNLLRQARRQPVFAETRFQTLLTLLSAETKATSLGPPLQERAAELAPSYPDLAISMLKVASSPA